MSDTIQIKKLKRIMYGALRWRLQLPNYYEHYPVPHDKDLNEFSRGVKCAYRDLLREIEQIENSDEQRKIWKKHNKGYNPNLYDDESFIDEIKEH